MCPKSSFLFTKEENSQIIYIFYCPILLFFIISFYTIIVYRNDHILYDSISALILWLFLCD